MADRRFSFSDGYCREGNKELHEALDDSFLNDDELVLVFRFPRERRAESIAQVVWAVHSLVLSQVLILRTPDPYGRSEHWIRGGGLKSGMAIRAFQFKEGVYNLPEWTALLKSLDRIYIEWYFGEEDE